MKIKEITESQLNEGVLDFIGRVGAGLRGSIAGAQAAMPTTPTNAFRTVGNIGGGLIKGAQTGYQTAAAQQLGKQQLTQQVQNVFKSWNTYYGQTKDPNILNWATRFFKKSIGRNSELKRTLPNITNSLAVKNWITQVLQKYQQGVLKDLSPTAPTAQQIAQPTAGSTARPTVRQRMQQQRTATQQRRQRE